MKTTPQFLPARNPYHFVKKQSSHGTVQNDE